jgi:hypothetical protein
MLEFMRQNWGWMLSFGTFMAAVIGYVFVRMRALSLGIQALLRAQMINDYNHYVKKGWAPLYARENFENCWIQYERLGKNGVMKDIREKFLALPTDPPARLVQEDKCSA